MSKKVFIASIVGAMLVSGVVSMFLTAHMMLPITKDYIGSDMRYIKLDDQEEPHPYWEILEQDFLGELYLHHPLLFHKRDEGYQLLKDLAERGYTTATNSLYDYHYHKLDEYTDSYFPSEDTGIKIYKDMHKWALLAAEQGNGNNLRELLEFFKLDRFKDVSYEIGILEDNASKSQSPFEAKFLENYYARQNNPKKAAHWAQVAADIKAAPFTEPACTTITPWRGY